MRGKAMILGAVALALVVAGQKAFATSLPPLTGPVMLKISGNIQHPNMGNELWLDRDMLHALPGRVIVTDTPWHRGTSRFEGPLLRSIVEAAGVESDQIRIHALNDFSADIPLSDLLDYDVILAMRRNGHEMAVRDFGPLFVLYPFDDHPELMNETTRFRSVWQVDAIYVP